MHAAVVAHRLFKRGERVAVAASGGKDSTVLAHMLTLLNARHECAGGGGGRGVHAFAHGHMHAIAAPCRRAC